MTWREPVIALLVAFGVAAVVTPVAGYIARKVGAIDRPRGRGLAAGGTPLLGGLGIAAAIAVAVLIAGPPDPSWLDRFARLDYVVLGIGVIVVFGACDDRFDLHPLLKLAGQTLAAWIPVSHGVEVGNLTLPFVDPIQFGERTGEILTVIGFVVTMNVVNLSDGVDGLASGVVAIAAIALGVIAWDLGKGHAALLAAALAGACFGFLWHNFYPARIFMGDVGSNALGYCLAAVAVEGSVKTGAVLAAVIPMLVLAVPLFDTAFVILKRVRSRKPIYAADSNHLHHRFSRIGFSQRRTVLYLYAWSAAMASLAIALRFVPYSDAGRIDTLWFSVICATAIIVLALSTYVIYVLEILKFRARGMRWLRRMEPDMKPADMDQLLERAIETGEIDAVAIEDLARRPSDESVR